MARGHPPPHCENTQVLREAINEDEDDDDETALPIKAKFYVEPPWEGGT